jgi:hypothetical protein
LPKNLILGYNGFPVALKIPWFRLPVHILWINSGKIRAGLPVKKGVKKYLEQIYKI